MPPQGDLPVTTDSLHVQWQEENENDDHMSALVPRVPQKSNSKRQAKRRTRRLLVCAVSAVLLVLAFSLSRSPSSSSQETSRQKQHRLPRVIQEVGWVSAVERFRVEFVSLLVSLKEAEDSSSSPIDSQHVDISRVYDQIEYALDIFGVRSVYTEVFDQIESYYPSKWHKEGECDNHGMDCYWQDTWWLWHYVGAITAEKLIRDGSLVLDGITGELLHDGVSVVREIHRIQEQPYVPPMSFHAEHGFIWQYLAMTAPNITSYPTELSEEFCGEYTNKRHVAQPAGKSIGYECYHGFGHAVYSVIAMRQNGDSSSSYDARTQLRPHGGFALTDKSFCEAYEICESAPTETIHPKKACQGGIRHSYKLFSNSLPRFRTKYDNQKYFKELSDRVCSSK